VLKIAGGPVSWQSCMQTSVALSSMESEYMAACAAAQEAIWLSRLLEKMGFRSKKPIIEEKKKRKKKTEILAKDANMTQKHVTAVKHWSPLSFYFSALPDLSLVVSPERSVSQPFPKGSRDE
jgi:hypothetical protein